MCKASVLPLALIAVLAACSNVPAPDTRHSGFLRDYSRLVADPVWSNSQYWVQSGVTAADYQKRILLDRPVLHVADAQQQQAAQRSREIAQLLAYLDSAIRRELRSGGYQLVSRPGADTLRLRTAITGSARTARDMSAVEFVPIGFVISSGMRAAGVRDESLRVFFETELIDAASGKLLAQSVSGTTGGELAPSAQAKVEDAYPALDAWARQLRERLDRAFAQ